MQRRTSSIYVEVPVWPHVIRLPPTAILQHEWNALIEQIGLACADLSDLDHYQQTLVESTQALILADRISQMSALDTIKQEAAQRVENELTALSQDRRKALIIKKAGEIISHAANQTEPRRTILCALVLHREFLNRMDCPDDPAWQQAMTKHADQQTQCEDLFKSTKMTMYQLLHEMVKLLAPDGTLRLKPIESVPREKLDHDAQYALQIVINYSLHEQFSRKDDGFTAVPLFATPAHDDDRAKKQRTHTATARRLFEKEKLPHSSSEDIEAQKQLAEQNNIRIDNRNVNLAACIASTAAAAIVFWQNLDMLTLWADLPDNIARLGKTPTALLVASVTDMLARSLWRPFINDPHTPIENPIVVDYGSVRKDQSKLLARQPSKTQYFFKQVGLTALKTLLSYFISMAALASCDVPYGKVKGFSHTGDKAFWSVSWELLFGVASLLTFQIANWLLHRNDYRIKTIDEHTGLTDSSSSSSGSRSRESSLGSQK